MYYHTFRVTEIPSRKSRHGSSAMQRYDKKLKQTNISGEIYCFSDRFRPMDYSVLMLLTGFSEAARQLWMMTVSREMMKQVAPAAANIQGLSAMR